MTIDERNALRAASGLPLLDREREAELAKSAKDQVELRGDFRSSELGLRTSGVAIGMVG